MFEMFKELGRALSTALRADGKARPPDSPATARVPFAGRNQPPAGTHDLRYRDLKRLIPFLRPHWRSGAAAATASLLSALLFTLIPLSLKYATDEAVLGGNRRLLVTIICLLVGALLLIALADFVKQFYFFRFQQEAVFDIQQTMLRKLLRLPKSFFDASSTGYLMSRGVGDAAQLQVFFSSALVDTFAKTLQLIFAVGVLLYLNWKLLLLSLVVVPMFVFASRAISMRARRLSHTSLEKAALVSRDLEESLSAATLVKTFAAEEREVWKLTSALRSAIVANQQRLVVTSFFSMISSVINAVGMGLVIWYGASLIIEKELTVGELLTFCAYLGLLVEPAKFLANLNNAFQHTFAALERVFDVLALIPEGDESKMKVDRIGGKVRFEKVCFSYDGEKEVLKDISFEVEPGQIVALVGPSGAGKSTLVNLILGLYNPSSGRIYIDDVTSHDLDLQSLRERIGVVSQEVFLFNESVKVNIRYGRHDASDEEVMEAARVAGADDFIQLLPDGYETRIGENGVKLSVGQKQRLSIARAILKEPDVFIFDEATSALDALTEQTVRVLLQDFCRGKTVFIIAHRLSTVVQSDVILTLDDGRIVQRGTHEELSAEDGLYRWLTMTQFSSAGQARPSDLAGAASLYN